MNMPILIHYKCTIYVRYLWIKYQYEYLIGNIEEALYFLNVLLKQEFDEINYYNTKYIKKLNPSIIKLHICMINASQYINETKFMYSNKEYQEIIFRLRSLFDIYFISDKIIESKNVILKYNSIYSNIVKILSDLSSYKVLERLHKTNEKIFILLVSLSFLYSRIGLIELEQENIINSNLNILDNKDEVNNDINCNENSNNNDIIIIDNDNNNINNEIQIFEEPESMNIEVNKKENNEKEINNNIIIDKNENFDMKILCINHLKKLDKENDDNIIGIYLCYYCLYHIDGLYEVNDHESEELELDLETIISYTKFLGDDIVTKFSSLTNKQRQLALDSLDYLNEVIEKLEPNI
eukprot:jgi/Orpsp1_1/1192809/evm.model.d7180000096045.1